MTSNRIQEIITHITGKRLVSKICKELIQLENLGKYLSTHFT